ncbi:hypothetical protein BH10ACI3_BH10ACI3_25240 [soil metagenome]
MIETGKLLQQRYRIDKQIGQGGMGAVYVATDERFGSTVAIKETLCMDDNFRKAIEREARLLNSLKHSALPRVSDHFEEDNGQFLVMEYIPGDDVAAMLEGNAGAFPVDRVLKWADELLDALDYLHNQDSPVIHRDIKPQNLKVNARGDIILLDFGLAKGNPTDAGHHTAAKSIFGYSRNYASLEQIQGTGTDPRSDLYSLAATLYHLLTKIAPEDALTRAMSVLSQKPDPLVPASAVNSVIPRGVAGVLQKALDLNAGERPQSAVEMRQMFRESENYAYLCDSFVSADNPTVPYVLAQPTKLMPDQTQAEAGKSTEMKTEVMAADMSQVTSVRTAQPGGHTNAGAAHLTAVPAKSRARFGLAAAALGLLLVCGAVAGGLYAVKPSLFGLGQTTENPPEPANVPSAANSNTEADVNANSGPTGATAFAQAGNTTGTNTSEAVRQTATEKPAEPIKNNVKNLEPGKTLVQTDTGDVIDFNVDDPDIPAGGVTITQKDRNGKVTTMRVNPAAHPPNPRGVPVDGGDPFPNGFDPTQLTPEQRRRLKAIIRKNNQLPPNVPQKP